MPRGKSRKEHPELYGIVANDAAPKMRRAKRRKAKLRVAAKPSGIRAVLATLEERLGKVEEELFGEL